MWAYKFIQKDSRLHVPRFKTFFYQNQEILRLWYEDENEPLEDRIPFYARSLKYIGHLCILFIILMALINAQDDVYNNICNNRLNCYNDCSESFFPSLLCGQYNQSVYITLNGNNFTNFYKYPDPNYVLTHFFKNDSTLNKNGNNINNRLLQLNNSNSNTS